MPRSVMFESPAARAAVEGWYERFRARIPVPTEARTVPTRHGDTHVLVGGPEGGPPVVVFHGAMASSAHLLGELGPLLTRFRLYGVDVLGQSPKSADTRLPVDGPAHGEWAADVLDALGLDRPHVLGVSWGGFVALRTAIAAPARVDRLVLLVPAGLVTGPVWAGIKELAIPIALYRFSPSPARLRRFAGALLTTLDDDWMPFLGDAMQSYRMDMRVPPLATAEELRGFDRPTLVIGADQDLSFPGAKLIARARELIPHAETELLTETRHSPPTTDAFRRRLTDRLARFLDGVSS